MIFYISLPILLLVSFLWALWSLKKELKKTEPLTHHMRHSTASVHSKPHRERKHHNEIELESGREIKL